VLVLPSRFSAARSGQSRIGAAACAKAQRAIPALPGRIQTMMILGLALIESLVLFALLIVFVKGLTTENDSYRSKSERSFLPSIAFFVPACNQRIGIIFARGYYLC
jgi:F0F1-type ATP synthase membrane subunit c/vacuolar-type H+-ATPase subunit K